MSKARLDPGYIGAVRTPNWKYIDDVSNARLYDLRDDIDESSNVLESNREVATALTAEVDAHRRRYSGGTRSTEHLDSDCIESI